ncbi:MAG: hypothetical protein NC339_05805 [Muribaculaceae bacterium]|nr:hypothetical protein [Muribaculaceae bacterium]
MKKTLKYLSLIAMTALLTTSCLSDDKENSQKVMLTYGGDQCFNRVVDLETGDEIISGNPSYQMTFEQLNATLDLEMSNIQLSSSYFGMSFKFPTLNYKYDFETAYYYVDAKDLVPTNVGSSYVFSNFSFKMVPTRIVDQRNCPLYLFDYTVNNKYHIVTYPVTTILVGESVAEVYEGVYPSGQTYQNENTDAFVAITIEPIKKTARITLYNARFEYNMLTRNIVIKDMPVTFTDSGLTLSTAEDQSVKLYTTTDKEMPDCSASDIALNFNLATGETTFSGHFELYDLTGVENQQSAYDVKMNLGYLYKVD